MKKGGVVGYNLILLFLSLLNREWHAQVLWTAVHSWLNDDWATSSCWTGLVRCGERVYTHFTKQNHIARCYWRCSSIFKPLNICVKCRYWCFHLVGWTHLERHAETLTVDVVFRWVTITWRRIHIFLIHFRDFSRVKVQSFLGRSYLVAQGHGIAIGSDCYQSSIWWHYHWL